MKYITTMLKNNSFIRATEKILPIFHSSQEAIRRYSPKPGNKPRKQRAWDLRN